MRNSTSRRTGVNQMPGKGITLSLDIGTSSTRAMLWDAQAVEIPGCSVQIKYEMCTDESGASEIDAELLLQNISRCLDQAYAKWGDRALNIACVGISAFWHGLVGLDKDLKPLTPILTWADTRSSLIAERLTSSLNPQDTHQRTGCMLHPSYYPAKLIWFRENQPSVFQQAAHWVSPGEYLFSRFFGAHGLQLSVSMASGTGLMNQGENRWDTQLLQELNLNESILTSISEKSTFVSGLTSEFASKWPALKDVPFLLPAGDGACSNIGSGSISSQTFAINLGTSGAIRVLSSNLDKKITLPHGIWRYRADSERSLIGAAFSDGGNLIPWMQKTLLLPPLDSLEDQLKNRVPGQHGLTMLPFLAGERSMGWNPEAEGAISGLKLSTDAADIAQSFMESVALRFALALSELSKLFPEADKIIVSGGALSQSEVWAQIFANALGKPLHMADEAEASSRGAALLAMEATGSIHDIGDCPASYGKTVVPNAAYYEMYRNLLKKQQFLYDKIYR